MAEIVRFYLEQYRFMGIGDYLGLPREQIEAGARTASAGDKEEDLRVTESHLLEPGPVPTTPVTVVVPCFNEELILPYLANTLRSVKRDLSPHYSLRFIFVDDGSSDGTWASLEELFGHVPNCLLLRHSENQGVAAAILTGMRSADTNVVCSIDCDCTYDPHQLRRLIPLLTDEVDMVTASPYHEEGEARNVPAWRLFLSKSLSRLYRLVLHHSLATYTSCFRVYRRSSVSDLQIRNGGFLGVAEMIGRLDLQGGAIVECPAVLEVRLLGRSKMKTLNTIVGHLALLARLGKTRLTSSHTEPLVNPRMAPDGTMSGPSQPITDSEHRDRTSG
jgi:glycosyltransferase involved in cell wall biosynthesis